MLSEIQEQLTRLEEKLDKLIEQEPAQEFYSTATAAERLGKAEFTVREWCRNGRIYAEKRPCGRGHSREWMIAHEELNRIRAEGLLPLR